MTEIDTHYLLDEIEILTQLVGYLAEELGLQPIPRVMECSLAEEAAARREARAGLVHGLFGELLSRRRLRQAHARGRGLVGGFAQVMGDLNTIDGMLDALRQWTPRSTMEAALASRNIRLAALEQDISGQLIFTALSRQALESMTLEDRAQMLDTARSLDPASDDPLTAPHTGEGGYPFLPPDVAAAWAKTQYLIIRKFDEMELDDLLKEYEDYLNDLLDAYAVGPEVRDGGSIERPLPIARYNEIDEERTLDRRFPTYKDTFWNRRAKVLRNTGFQVGEPVGEQNPPYTIEIVFEPRQLAELRTTGEVVLIRREDVVREEANGLVYITSARGTYHGTIPAARFYKLDNEGEQWWMAFYRPFLDGERRFATGHTKTEAMVNLVLPEVPDLLAPPEDPSHL